MDKFYGLVYDVSKDCFREDRVEGKEGIINIACHIAALTHSDEEPYTIPIKTIENALEFLDLYDYEIIPVNKHDYELFGELVEKNPIFNNRLSHILEEEFYDLAIEFNHKAFQI